MNTTAQDVRCPSAASGFTAATDEGSTPQAPILRGHVRGYADEYVITGEWRGYLVAESVSNGTTFKVSRKDFTPIRQGQLICSCGERETEDGGEFGFYTLDDGSTVCNACGSTVTTQGRPARWQRSITARADGSLDPTGTGLDAPEASDRAPEGSIPKAPIPGRSIELATTRVHSALPMSPRPGLPICKSAQSSSERVVGVRRARSTYFITQRATAIKFARIPTIGGGPR